MKNTTMKTENEKIKKQEQSLEPPRPKSKRRATPVFSPAQIARQEQYRLEKRLQKLDQDKINLKGKTERVRKKKYALTSLDKAIDGVGAHGRVITDEVLADVPEELANAIDGYIFKPNPGPQTEFLASSEQEVLYGGAAGGGKSFALLADAVRDAWNPSHAALILRRSLDELRELVAKSKTLYTEAYPGCVWSIKNNTWTFPSGATIWLTYSDNDDDLARFQGLSWNYIGFDELTHWPTSNAWDFLRSRLRTTAPELPTLQRATTNPGGVGAYWVKRMFIDPGEHGKAFWATDISTPNNTVITYPETHWDVTKRTKPIFRRRFIPARLSDNPYLFADGKYEATLLGLPDIQRRRLLDGDWDVTDGAAFPEFRRATHVCEPFKIPTTWPKFRGADYGYREPACVLWFAVDFDGCLYVYRELYGPGMDAEQLADKVVNAETTDGGQMIGWLDSSVWSRRGDIGPSIAETMMRRGCLWRPADRSPGSRINGKMELHRRLKCDVEQTFTRPSGETYTVGGRPNIKIFSNCVNLIRTIPVLPVDKTNAEDVDTKAEDHAYDALRYGIMSRPMTPADAIYMDNRNISKPRGYRPADSIMGY